jgi:CheY-like chemotaxis protein
MAHVLVIEDDHDLRESLSEVLEAKGFEVRTAIHGEAALVALREGELPSAIVLDLMMPVMNGWEFRYQQLSDPRLAAIPTVIMSAIVSQAASMGALATLAKPVSLADLVSVLEPCVAADAVTTPRA